MRLGKILCPVDFSDPAREALHYASDLARQFDASLTLLHVYQPPAYALPEGFVLAGPEVLSDLLERIDESLREWQEEARERGVLRVDTTASQGTPWQEIVRAADEGEYDLIVVGTHGRSGLKHVLLGSVAEKVVQKAHCPVLAVRLSDHVYEEARVP